MRLSTPDEIHLSTDRSQVRFVDFRLYALLPPLGYERWLRAGIGSLLELQSTDYDVRCS